MASHARDNLATVKPLEDSEWNFDDVPDDELAACCLWEYGRECIVFAISSARHAEQVAAFRAGGRPKSEPDPEYEAFLNAYWNSDEGYMAYYETIRTHGGPDARPWVLIPAEIRDRLKKQVGVHQVSWPLAVAMRRQLEALWKTNLPEWEPVRNEPGYELDDDSMAWESSHPHIQEPGHAGEPHGETIVAFAIDFRKFTDKQIVEAFVAWLSDNRPKDCPEHTKRGKKQRDLRVALDRLGMMRLLNQFTLREMPKRCPEAWKAFAGYDWYKERKRMVKTFHQLFPFLPEYELPLSWPTKGARKTWAGNTR